MPQREQDTSSYDLMNNYQIEKGGRVVWLESAMLRLTIFVIFLII